MSEGLLEQGLELLYYGMGTVFAFLTLLVLAMSLMSVVIKRFEPKAIPATVDAKPDGIQPEKLAAITAAIHAHRNKHKN